MYLKQKYIFALQVAAYQSPTALAVLILPQYEEEYAYKHQKIKTDLETNSTPVIYPLKTH